MTSITKRRAAGALGGLIAAGTALVLGYLIAQLTGGPWPVDAVGVQTIDLSPGPVKDWAVRNLGTADRTLLRVGICAVLGILAAVAGAIGVTRRRLAIGIAVALGAVGVLFAVIGRSATTNPVIRVLPAIVTLIVAVAGMILVTRVVRVRRAAGGDAEAPAGFDRRRFLVTVSAMAAAGVAGQGANLLVPPRTGEAARARVKIPRPADAADPLPAGVSADVRGVSPFVTSNDKFYRVDTALQVPRIDPDQWSLRIHGMVDRELELSLPDLLGRRLVERDITLTCVSNEVGGPYVGNARWIGVPIAEVLREAGVQGDADAVLSTSVDGLTIGTPLPALTDGRDGLFAIAMNGQPLPFEHGFPVRMVVPGLYGYVSATKWITEFEVTKFPEFSAYWTDRGWSEQAPIKTSSRIDVPKGFARIKSGPAVVAGVAWAQRRGIRKVEVQVDDGPWLAARLAAEDSIDTWRQWTFRWDATPGNHRLTVRATDGQGQVQTAERAAPRPNGSSGLHNTVVIVE